MYFKQHGLEASMGTFSYSLFLDDIVIEQLRIENVGGTKNYVSKEFVNIGKIQIARTSAGIDVLLSKIALNLERSGLFSRKFNFTEVLEKLASNDSQTNVNATPTSTNTKQPSQSASSSSGGDSANEIRSIVLSQVNATLRLASIGGVSAPVVLVIPRVNVNSGHSTVRSIPQAMQILIGAIVLTVLATAGQSVSGVAGATAGVAKVVGTQSLDVARIMSSSSIQVARQSLQLSAGTVSALVGTFNHILYGFNEDPAVAMVIDQFREFEQSGIVVFTPQRPPTVVNKTKQSRR
jgi:hypothetical protein